MKDLHDQEARIFSGAPSAVDGMGTRTGTKDKYLQHFIDDVQKKLNTWRSQNKAQTEGQLDTPNATQNDVTQPSNVAQDTLTWQEKLSRRLQELRTKMPANLFNPVLQIPSKSL